MEYAEITAPLWAHRFHQAPYRMLLAQWVLKYPSYARHHERRRRSHKSFVILDNGAFEGVCLTADQLIAAAMRVRPDEVVLTDVRHDPKATLRKSWVALQRLQELRWLGSVMFVPHGGSLEEWSECLDAWLEVWASEPRPVTLTIGVHGMRDPEQKAYAQPQLKVRVMKLAAEKGYPVHMLGCGDIQAFCEEELAVAHKLEVRGIDTSVPFVAGTRGKLLTPATKKIQLGGVTQYKLSWKQLCLAKLNVRIFRHWVTSGEATDEIPIDVIRETCREWRKYWAEGFASAEDVMKSCMFPKGWYAVRREKRPGRAPKQASVRPLSSSMVKGRRELREHEDLLKISYKGDL